MPRGCYREKLKSDYTPTQLLKEDIERADLNYELRQEAVELGIEPKHTRIIKTKKRVIKLQNSEEQANSS